MFFSSLRRVVTCLGENQVLNFCLHRFLSNTLRVGEAVQRGATYRDLDTALRNKQLFMDDDLPPDPSLMAVDRPEVPSGEDPPLPIEEKRLCELEHDNEEDAETVKAVFDTLNLIPQLFTDYEKFDSNLA